MAKKENRKNDVKVKAKKEVKAKTKTTKPLQGTSFKGLTFGKSTFQEPVSSDMFKAMVKAKKGFPVSLFTINKREKELTTGKVYDLDFGKVALPKSIRPTLQGLYAKHGYMHGSYQFCVKAGYGAIQAGYNRQGVSSWKGLIALNDGQYCVWSWPEKGLTMNKIAKIGNDNELTRNHQGKNWITYHFSKNNTKNLVKFGNEILNVVK